MGNLQTEMKREEEKLQRLLAVTAEAIREAPQGKYIRKSNIQMAKDIAQRDYDLQIQKTVQSRLDGIHKLQRMYENNDLESTYEKLNSYRKELVEPRILSDKDFIEKWEAVQYTGKLFQEGTAVISTDRGESVRSKSEKIIADMLYRRGIPYRYEAPIALKGRGIVYPDFTILNVRNRKEVYWEHLGMMDNRDYCENALRKMEAYQKTGIILGDRLIITYESSRYPLETEMIERNIRVYC